MTASNKTFTALLSLAIAFPVPALGSDDVPAAPEDGGPRNWQIAGVTGSLNVREQPSTAAPVVGRHRRRVFIALR